MEYGVVPAQSGPYPLVDARSYANIVTLSVRFLMLDYCTLIMQHNLTTRCFKLNVNVHMSKGAKTQSVVCSWNSHHMISRDQNVLYEV